MFFPLATKSMGFDINLVELCVSATDLGTDTYAQCTLELGGPTPLLGHFPGSASQGKLGLLDSHHVLETGYLGRQSLDLRSSLCLLAG